MGVKGVVWVGASREAIARLPASAKRELGADLNAIQAGREARDWKVMGSVGAGVIEIRVRAGGSYRLMYVAKYPEAVYVLHVFQKKSRKTAPLDLALARVRFAAMQRLRRESPR